MKKFVLRDSRGDTGTNCNFWRQGGGYTSNFSEAELFDTERALAQHRSRKSDIPIAAALLEPFLKKVVDCQYLPNEAKESDDEQFVIQAKGRWDGNDIFFITHNKTSTIFTEAKIFDWKSALEFVENNTQSYAVFSHSKISKISRAAIDSNIINQHQLAKQANIMLEV